jgi:hypothetical protein
LVQDLFLKAAVQPESNLSQKVRILKHALELAQKVEDVDVGLLNSAEERFGAAKSMALIQANLFKHRAADKTGLSEQVALLEQADALALCSEDAKVISEIGGLLKTASVKQLQTLEEELGKQLDPCEKIAVSKLALELARRVPVERNKEKELEKALSSAKHLAFLEATKLLERLSCDVFPRALQLAESIADDNFVREVKAKGAVFVEQLLSQGATESEPLIKANLFEKARSLAASLGDTEHANAAKVFLESMGLGAAEQIEQLRERAKNTQDLQEKLKLLKSALQLARSVGVYSLLEGLWGEISEIQGKLDGDVCPICIEPLGNADTIACSSRHKLHKLCYRQMPVAAQTRCPICRADIS